VTRFVYRCNQRGAGAWEPTPPPPIGSGKKSLQPFSVYNTNRDTHRPINEVLFINIVNVNVTKSKKMSKMSNFLLSDAFFQALNTPKLVFGWGCAPDHPGGTDDAPETP